jgi:CRISPR/Cas system-associated protein Cas5 (RAMP superfamily)
MVKVTIVDFGCSKSYVDINNIHISEDDTVKAFEGNFLFASIN